jgi:hypothetical protein
MVWTRTQGAAMRIHILITAVLASALLAGCANRGSEGQGMGGMRPAQSGHGMSMAQPAQLAQMDERLRAMADAHGKMMSAKSPEERKALMAEHHNAMREGMAAMHASMGTMGPGAHCMNPAAMQKHQAMMQMMMQMMAETPDAPPPVPAPG